MKIRKINESWEDEGIKDPTKKVTVTNTGYLLQCLTSGLNKEEFGIHKANYTVDGVEAQIVDKKSGIFYNLIIKPAS